MFKMRDLKVWEWNHRFKTVYDGLTKAEARTRCALGKKTYVHSREPLCSRFMYQLGLFSWTKNLNEYTFSLSFFEIET